MGRKRTKEIVPGSQVILYLPQDIDTDVLKYLNEQPNTSKILLELAYDKVYNRNVSSNVNIESLIEEIESRVKANAKILVSELIEEELKKRSNKRPEDKKATLMSLDNDSMFGK